MQRIAVEPQQILDRTIYLNAAQEHYLKRVLRSSVGDRFVAMDGRGQWWEAQLVMGDDGSLLGEIDRQLDVSTELPVSATLFAALPKGSGFDEVVRQTTELGVSRIVPVLSQRTLLNPSPNKLKRWRRIATEAAEQSERQIVPELCEPLSFREAMAAVGETPSYFCVARGTVPHLSAALQTALEGCDAGEIAIFVGPEGGWTTDEVQQAKDTGCQLVSLGRRVLRAVTAPVVALSVVAAVWETR
ncbi:16S rRNA (uracil(1498)-N(3))-methyltransferase [Baaleninema sp.]|uniref:16S rRNA (uracil(1498)-N(3))-methyltransferase n=1 Tax=Baaleninema sp. TaxID=3101197 RepID=UPI003D03463E